MEQFDTEMAARVWKRVQNRERPEVQPDGRKGQDSPAQLLFSARELAAMYQALSRKMPGKDRERLRQLYSQEQRNVACLKGICKLCGQERSSAPLPEPKEPARRLLEKCCHKARKNWAEYQARTEDPEYGVVFQRLARQAGEHCMALMEILGRAK